MKKRKKREVRWVSIEGHNAVMEEVMTALQSR